jgi:hypothetical protein
MAIAKYKVIIKAGSIFHHHSRRNNMNNLHIDEDIEVELDEGVEILFNCGTFRLGIFNNNYLPIFFNNNLIILKKGTKYINTNINEDSLGFTKKLDEDQQVYFNSGTCIEIPANTPMYSLCGNLKFILSSPITGHGN